MNTQISSQSYSLSLKIYFYCLKYLQKIVVLINACFTGFWLGILPREILQSIDKFYYDNEKMYHMEEYNLQGLWDWEEKILNNYFQECKTLLLIGAGGGREVIALEKLGYQVDGCECHPELVKFANELMKKQGLNNRIQLVERDEVINTSKIYDGIIVGWGAYMLIQGKKRRIEFLKKLRSQLTENSPIFISFFCYSGANRYFRTVKKISDTIRWVMRREPVDLGDNLEPEFVHYFTKEEIAAELKSSGFEIVMYQTEEYGHALGIAI